MSQEEHRFAQSTVDHPVVGQIGIAFGSPYRQDFRLVR